jgi:multiple sugar transport system substrate-binding protein/putative aldouronate transport system substrate-binding protein
MKIRKPLALLLATVIIFTFAAACESSGGGEGNDRGDPITLTVYTQLANFSGFMSGWAAEILLERFNVRMNIINDQDGTFATLMESRNLGDIVILSKLNDYLDAVEAGVLFDWEEDNLVQDFAPYIWENMQRALEKNRDMSDGTLLGFGNNVAINVNDFEDSIYHPDIRWDLYSRLGYPPVNTLEDFIPILEAMVALEPVSDVGTKTYGVSMFPDWDDNMVMMVKSTAALYGYDEFHFGLYCTQTQTFQGALEEGGEYLRALRFYNQLFQRGLLDPDSMSQTWDGMVEKYTNGAAFFNIFNYMASHQFNTPENLAEGRGMFALAAADQKNLAYGLNVFGGNWMWSIGANTAHPELCMEIINWLATPEGVLTYLYGPQGVTWDYDDDGNTYMTELGIMTRDDADTEISYGSWTGRYRDGTFEHNNTTWNSAATNPESARGESFDWETWLSTLEVRTVTDIEQSWRDFHGGIKRTTEYLRNNGHFSVSIGSRYSARRMSRELTTIWNQVKNAIVDGSWDAIYARSDEEFDAIVAQMIANAKAYGYDTCIEWIEEEALRRKAAEDEALGLR